MLLKFEKATESATKEIFEVVETIEGKDDKEHMQNALVTFVASTWKKIFPESKEDVEIELNKLEEKFNETIEEIVEIGKSANTEEEYIELIKEFFKTFSRNISFRIMIGSLQEEFGFESE
jgi:hypothetical protein